MYIKEYTLYVDEKDKVVKMTSTYVDGDVACYGAMINLGDNVKLIRVRDKVE
ncbi:MAG: hypothetical protein KAR39_10900 [Thermoplasmata archaeon]|nr:hypothetical protein [Thermoplasmata archaeon]